MNPPSEIASRSRRTEPREVTTARGTVKLTPTVPPVTSTYGFGAASRRRYEAHRRQLRAERHHTRPEEQRYANEVAIVPLTDTIAFDALPRPEAVVSEVKITYCNRAYARAWF